MRRAPARPQRHSAFGVAGELAASRTGPRQQGGARADARGVGGLRRGGAAPESAATSIDVTAWMMQPGDDKVVAERLFEVLSRKRGPKAAPAAPAASLSGRWDVEVVFFSSKSQHTLTLEQN